MSNILLAFQIASALTLIGLILIQSKGTGLGKAWGISGGTSFARRGLEKLIFKFTFLAASAFIIISVIQVLH